MAILIKNPEVERKARELASLRGLSITAAIDGALDRAIAEAQPRTRRPTVEEMEAATERFRQAIGLKLPQPPVTKAEWDEINEIPGLAEDDS
jgi:antitoxin VapB